MITVDQIRNLESKVERLLGVLEELRAANATLSAELEAARAAAAESASQLEEAESSRQAAAQKLQDLEELLGQFRSDQEEIEASFNRTLHHLDALDEPASDGAEAKLAEEPAGEQSQAEPDDDQTEPTAEEPESADRQDAKPASSEGAELDIF